MRPTTPRTTITGPHHPLDQAIARGRTLVARHRADAVRLQGDARAHDDLAGSMMRLRGAASWEHVGSMTDSAHLLGASPDLVSVHPGHSHTDGLAVVLARVATGEHDVVDPESAAEWRTAASAASPMVDVLLAACVHADLVDWDTGESVVEASRRLAKDAALRFARGSGHTRPVLVRPSAVWAEVVATIGVVDRPAAQWAQAWLDQRGEIVDGLGARGIRWGGTRLSAQDAADHVRVGASTWRAYCSRGQAPTADRDGTWRLCTLDAWRLTRGTTIGWW